MIDASSAHRTQPGWTYGFPEMAAGQAPRIAGALRVSNPGCYPTGAIGLLRPLVGAGLLPHDYPIAIHAVSGYSGGGRTAVDTYEGPEATWALPFQVYGLGLAHKHTPEIQQHAGLARRPAFVPAYGAFRQGIVLTVALELDLLASGTDVGRLHACLLDHYADARHVEVMPLAESAAATHLDPQALNGTNDLRLWACSPTASTGRCCWQRCSTTSARVLRGRQCRTSTSCWPGWRRRFAGPPDVYPG